MNTYLIKREVAKDGNPKEDGYYLIIFKGTTFTALEQLQFINGVWTNGESEFDHVTHYYEPILLSELIEERMPSEEEKEYEASRFANSKIDYSNLNEYDLQVAFSDGIDWLKNKLTNKT